VCIEFDYCLRVHQMECDFEFGQVLPSPNMVGRTYLNAKSHSIWCILKLWSTVVHTIAYLCASFCDEHRLIRICIDMHVHGLIDTHVNRLIHIYRFVCIMICMYNEQVGS